MRRILLLASLACSAGLILSLGSPIMAQASDTTRDAAVWNPVEELIKEQKLSEAATRAQTILEQARRAGHEELWAEALVRLAQLRIALHGYETAVEELRTQPWPKARLPRMALQLYYAQALITYLDAYAWEIRQREEIAEAGQDASRSATLDLKRWTAEQIYSEALAAFDAIWQERNALGKIQTQAFARFIKPNNYPTGIRPTVRDAITYLAVPLLANSSYWRPEELNEVDRLDPAALLQGRSLANDALSFSDRKRHPLQKLSAVLVDLESWHEDEDRDEAALEAYLERGRLLHQSLSDAKQRERIAQTIAKKLANQRTLPWWSMGMADLARMAQTADDLIKAHQLAKQGYDAHPQSVGGKMCESLIKHLEHPHVSLMAKTIDGPRRRSIQISHRNVSKLYFRAYALDLSAHIAQAKSYEVLPSHADLRRIAASATPRHSWSETLPDSRDFKSHHTYVTPPFEKPGLYVIAASLREDFASADNVVLGIPFVVSNMAILSRVLPEGEVEVTVVDGTHGAPQRDVEIRLYRANYQTGHQLETTVKSGADGVAHLTRKPGAQGAFFLVAQRGDDIALDPRHQSLRGPRPQAKTTHEALLYTDRSIYRPGQEIAWKILAYESMGESTGDEARYTASADAKVTVTLYDANNQIVASKDVRTNVFGTASGTFAIPEGRLLGPWSIATSYGRRRANIRVEEYKRPTFEVTLNDPKSPLRLNREASISGDARYYFGLPLTEGKVRWRVSREPNYPWWWRLWFPVPDEGRQSIASGESPLDAQGHFKIDFRPEAATTPAEVSYRYLVEVDLTDAGGETRSASRAYTIGHTTMSAAIQHDQGFVRPGESVTLKFVRTTLDGAPRSGKGRYKVIKLREPGQVLPPADLPLSDAEPKATPGDRLRPRWAPDYVPEREMARWEDGPEAARGEAVHDQEGLASINLPKLTAGAYRLRYESVDEYGAPFSAWRDLIVAAPGDALALPAYLRVERSRVDVGEVLRILAGSGAPEQTLLLDIHRDGAPSERKQLKGGITHIVEIPIREADRGEIGISLNAIMDHQLIALSEKVHVPWSNKELQLELTTFRDRLTPGAKESFRVTVKGPKASKAAAEVLAYMYDRSLDFFVPHQPTSPLSLYPVRASTLPLRYYGQPSYGTSLGAAGLPSPPEAPTLQDDRLHLIDGGGIGGPGHIAYAPSMPFAVMAEAGGTKRMTGRRSAKPEAMVAESESVAVPDQEPDIAQAAVPDLNLRQNFAETAFFYPHLQADKNGQVSFEFRAPDSVTSWSLWLVAVTRDLKSAVMRHELRTVKDLMVRPYLPRFFREGDQAELRVQINNASERTLKGELDLLIQDPERGADLNAAFGIQPRKPFAAPAGGSTTLTFGLKVPERVRLISVKVSATAGTLRDGELHPLPILPARVHLSESRFVALKDQGSRDMSFDELIKTPDPSRIDDRMVVTLDGQLYYSVLQALPYLIDYPHECTEQVLNRFVSTGILASVYKGFPMVAEMAASLPKRTSPLAAWDRRDPNLRMTLEESPWLIEAHGGELADRRLIEALDPSAVKQERDASLSLLRKAQTASGGFPWFPGGPPSPFMTLYLMHGFAKAAEFGVEVPRDLVTKGWAYLAQHYRDEYAPRLQDPSCCLEFLTFLNYVASSYPDASWIDQALTADERKRILDHSFANWTKLSPYLKTFVALTLKRAGRDQDARRVLASIMDAAKTDPDLGTYWAPEDRAWLWYNDTVETHAFALRTMLAVMPDDPRIDGMVQWLFLNKKLNHWRSTRTTAEVIYVLAHYLQAKGTLGIAETATVVAGPRRESFSFDPRRYEGRAQLVLEGAEIEAFKKSEATTITVSKESPGLLFASSTWHYSTTQASQRNAGDLLAVERRFFKRDAKTARTTLTPLKEGDPVKVGDEIEVQLSLTARHAAEYVHLRDPRPAGTEPAHSISRHRGDLGILWYEEIRDSGSNFFFERLPAGEYTFKHRLRATTAGRFKASPATVQSMYAPEFNAHSSAASLRVEP